MHTSTTDPVTRVFEDTNPHGNCQHRAGNQLLHEKAICDAGGPEEVVTGVLAHAGFPSFDLTDITARVRKENPDIAEADLIQGEKGYREFMRDAKLRPQDRQSPTLLVDKFWHAHILFTRKYARDCQDYFGFFLHHNPRSEEDRICDAGGCDRSICDAGGPEEISQTAH